jgi:hypothetical protein
MRRVFQGMRLTEICTGSAYDGIKARSSLDGELLETDVTILQPQQLPESSEWQLHIH